MDRFLTLVRDRSPEREDRFRSFPIRIRRRDGFSDRFKR